MMSFQPYKPRRVEPLDLWRPNGLAIKPYTIARDGADAPSLALIGTARRIAETEIPKAAAYDTGHHGLGFAILHEGEEAIWLLLHWWAHGDICCRALFRADSGTLEFEDVSKRSLMACVWELRVIDHERQAWVNAMLTHTPDAETYLKDKLPAGLY